MAFTQARLSYFSPQPATQSLRGLGAAAAPTKQQQQAQVLLRPLMAQVQGGLDKLVSTAKTKTREIADEFKGNWFNYVRSALSFVSSKKDADQAADDWAKNIVDYAETVRDTLSRVDASGMPFFVRKPEAAQKILSSAKDDLNELIQDFGNEVKRNGFKAIVADILETLMAFLMQIAQLVIVAFGSALAQFPVGGIAITAALGFVVWFKFLR